MENKNYSATIEVEQSPEEAFRSINKVTKWWSENLEGNTENLNDCGRNDFQIDAIEQPEIIGPPKVVDY